MKARPTPRELRAEAMRVLRDVSPNVALASELLARAEVEDEKDRRLRRALQTRHARILDPELFSGCECGGAE